MPSGKFLFRSQRPGYARWWSEDCGIDLYRRHMELDNIRWQRNFNSLDFDLRRA